MKIGLVAILDVNKEMHGYTATEVVNVLKTEGVKAKTGHSPYVGTTAVHLTNTNLGEIKKAYKVLKNYGYINGAIKEYVNEVKFNMEMGDFI